ncbi:DUF3310 domain-containing protein [Peptoniphilus asaccharolyticus]
MSNSIIVAIEDLLDDYEESVYNHEDSYKINECRSKVMFAINEFLMDESSVDNVNSPSHYKLEGLGIESKDVIKATYGPKGYIYWACGNAMKYLFRWEKKNGLEDLKKARKNLDFAIETLE